jgi:opacity protein-like surface antigen
MVRRQYLFALLAVLCAPIADAREKDTLADFDGLFVGLTTGYAFGASGDWCNCTFLPSVADAAEGEGGIIVGGEVGYGLRLGPIAVEAAARAAHADVKFAESCGTVPCSGKTGWLAEAQLSAGVVVFDGLLIAGTWGYALADVEAQVGAADASTSAHDGIVLAARIEQAMSGGWRMGLEYRHYDMQGESETPAGDADIDWTTEAVALVIHYEL